MRLLTTTAIVAGALALPSLSAAEGEPDCGFGEQPSVNEEGIWVCIPLEIPPPPPDQEPRDDEPGPAPEPVPAGQRQTPSPRPRCTLEAADPGGGPWYRNASSQPTSNVEEAAEQYMIRRCEGSPGAQYVWVPVGSSDEDTPADAPPPPPDPADLAAMIWPGLAGSVPPPTIRAAPAETDEDGYVYVQVPTAFWVDEWEDSMSQSMSAMGVAVTVTVEPVRLDVDLGNGDTISCDDLPVFDVNRHELDTFDGCTYTYRHSSAVAPNGQTWPATAQLVWEGSWTSNVGQSGSMGQLATSSTRDVAVAEIQAVLVPS